ncbi:MAG: hypothetical protein H6R18_2711 [Proteobacteria bacterium]|nr:hypothetical protein [Pseudomonadota bacterium]
MHVRIIAWAHNVAMLRAILLLLLVTASPAWAWNSGAHRLIAHIAWQQLSPSAKSAISSLLLAHPDYDRWTEHHQGKQFAFVEASTWPDDIRQDARFYEEFADPPTPSIAGLATTARHRNWHYTDRQLDGSPREGKGSLDTELPRLVAILADSSASRSQKVYALPWVIHLVGEMHQPLHIGSNHDKGGNLFEVEDFADQRQPAKTLHRWWDDLPAAPWLNGKALENSAQRLLAQTPHAPAQGNFELWQQESFEIARAHAYPPGRMITPEFRTQAKTIANRRVVEAGYRLGSLLRAIFGGVSRGTGSE